MLVLDPSAVVATQTVVTWSDEKVDIFHQELPPVHMLASTFDDDGWKPQFGLALGCKVLMETTGSI